MDELKYTKYIVYSAMTIFLIGFTLDILSTEIALRTVVGAYESNGFIRSLMENGLILYWHLLKIGVFFALPYVGKAVIEKHTNDWELIWQYDLAIFCLFVIHVGTVHLRAGIHNLKVLGWI